MLAWLLAPGQTCVISVSLMPGLRKLLIRQLAPTTLISLMTLPLKKTVLWQILAIIAAGICCMALFWLPTELPNTAELNWTDRWFALGADPSRFLLQGKWIAEGRGFRETTPDGAFCTSLPPGYPLFLAALSFFSANLQLWRVAQCVILIGSSIAMFLSCRRYAPRLAFWLSLGVVGSPWLSPLCSLFMSEGLGASLACVVAALLVTCSSVSDVAQSKRVKSHFAFGFLCSVLSLTSPGLAPVLLITLLQTCSVQWNSANRGRWCLLGASLPIILWQTHCVYASGRPAWLLVQALEPQPGRKWVDSWARSERETVLGYSTFLWATSPPDLSLIPQYAYRDSSERKLVERLMVESFEGDQGDGDGRLLKRKRLTSLLDSIAMQERKTHPLRVFLYLPVIRGISSWTDLRATDFRYLEDPQQIARLDPRNFARDLRQFGIGRSLVRLIRPCLALCCISYHVVLLTGIVFVVFVVMRSKDWFSIGVLLTVWVFVVLHGYGGPEARRNLPMVPILFCLPIVAAARADRKAV